MDVRIAHFKELGNNCIKEQDYQSAIDHYKTGLAIDPKNPILNCNVSQAYLNLKNYMEAERYAKKAIEYQSDYTKAYFRAAKAAFESHRLFDSMVHLSQGVDHCSGKNVEDLFAMAKELSEEFEIMLRKHYTEKSKEGEGQFTTKADCRKPTLSKEVPKYHAHHGVNSTLVKKKQEEEQENEQKAADLRQKERELAVQKQLNEKAELERKAEEHKEHERREKEVKEAEKKRKEEAHEKLKQNHKRAVIVLSPDDLQSQMKEGSMALLKGLNHKAVECFKKVQDYVIAHKSPQNLGLNSTDLLVMPFALSQALILSDEYKDVVKGIKILENLEEGGKHTKLPAILVLLGRAFMRLNRFEYAQQPLERGLSFINRGTSFTRYSWPGTLDVIDLTDRSSLKKALEEDLRECKVYRKPDRFCCYRKCLSLSQHILPSNNIFFSDLDFAGYVCLACQEGCDIYFHPACWKDYKETLSAVKCSEKDILGRHCLTPDCLSLGGKISLIVRIRIFGPDGEEKSTYKMNPIPSALIESKDTSKFIGKSPKKKQQRKKDSNKAGRPIEKKPKVDSKSKNSTHNNNISNNNTNNDITTPADVIGASDPERFQEAIQRLVLAREKDFGYDRNTPDPRKAPPVTSGLRVGKDEEFIYTFFLEIFKAEGSMPVETLKEHWETNKDILPDLQPALVTFTDLARFLLDSKMFAIVQDRIGLVSELSDIYTDVQGRSGVLYFEKVKAWQPSPATAFEVNKSMTANSVNESLNKIGVNKLMHTGISSNMADSCESSVTSKVLSLKISDTCSSPGQPAAALYKFQVPNGTVKSAYAEEDSACYYNKFSKPAKQLNISSDSVLFPHLGIKVTPAVVTNIQSQSMYNVQTINSVSSKQVSVAERVTWKPRAKLLDWATNTFPNETIPRLWRALTIVRSQNNNTLSHLSFEDIAARVTCTLPKLDGEI